MHQCLQWVIGAIHDPDTHVYKSENNLGYDPIEQKCVSFHSSFVY